MTDNKTKRREFLKKTAVTGGLAGASGITWIKPVVDSVVLPAHAQTSAGGYAVAFAAGLAQNQADPDSTEFLYAGQAPVSESIMDRIVPPASAEVITGTVKVTLEPKATNTYYFKMLITSLGINIGTNILLDITDSHSPVLDNILDTVAPPAHAGPCTNYMYFFTTLALGVQQIVPGHFCSTCAFDRSVCGNGLGASVKIHNVEAGVKAFMTINGGGHDVPFVNPLVPLNNPCGDCVPF